MIKKISFKNYKIFKNWQTLELKPITILIGKNSSGKSAVLKLPTLIEGALSGLFPEPLRVENNGVEAGSDFSDLVYGRSKLGRIEIILESEMEKLSVIVGSTGILSKDKPEILFWKHNDNEANVSLEMFSGFLSKTNSLSEISLTTDYISSRREGLERSFGKPNHYDFVGVCGENVYSILIENAFSTLSELISKVSNFYQDNFEGWGININEDKSPFFQIELVNDNLRININEVGLGMLHALPLVTRAFLPSATETLIIIEEPELHLHPAAHGPLAELFAKSARNDSNKNYLIETHSQNFVLRLRRLIAEGELDKNDVIMYYVDFDETTKESRLVKITIDEIGKPRNEQGDIYWPTNIFSETLDETSAIRTAQLKRQSDGS